MKRWLFGAGAATLVGLSAVWLGGCSCSLADEGDDAGTTRSDGSSADGATQDGEARRDGSLSHEGGAAGGSDASAGSDPEVCDGVDNDGNGIIDDVDEAMDGLCDCLAIATLGRPGTWGEGNVFSAWLDERSSTGAVSLGDETLTEERLAPFQVLVIQDVRGREYDDAEMAALEAWVREGGGIFSMIGYGPPEERTNANRLLAPFSLHYDAEPVLYVGGSTTPVTTWASHPVSEGVMRVGIDNGYEVTGDGVPIASESEWVLLRGVQLDEGHVLAFGDEWISYDSEWTEHPDYQVERFWLNSLKWLTRETECQVPILF